MGRQLKRIKSINPSEFDLDLAPLLAVMVKLVPVLLLSSAFVQVMVVETDLPQAVKEAIQKQDDKKPVANIQINSGGIQTIKYAGGTPNTGTASNTDIMSFSLISLDGTNWRILGQISNYG
jgi:biopolymer transport protein ExbD